MPDSATAALRFQAALPLPLTSDGGLPWLAAADRTLDLCATLARCLSNRRAANTRHALVDLVRHAPLLKLVCGRLPVIGPPLASQPTLSRLDNLPQRRDCYRMAVALG